MMMSNILWYSFGSVLHQLTFLLSELIDIIYFLLVICGCHSLSFVKQAAHGK